MKLAEFMVGSFWGKARPNSDHCERWHPLAWHLLDVAACAERILTVRPCARRMLSKAFGLHEFDAVRVAVLLAAFHDLGKFSAPFQRKAEGPEWPFSRPRSAQFGVSEHDREGLSVWIHHLGAKFAPSIWPQGSDAIKQLLAASVGHHGRAVTLAAQSALEVFQPEGIAAATECVAQLIELLLPQPVCAPAPGDGAMAAISFWFAGFVTVSDWAGSGQAYFPYRSPDVSIAAYWADSQRQATKAIRALGLESSPSSAVKQVAELTGQSIPTPLQDLAAKIDLGEGPVLIVIEDVTGAGKTEAAQILVNRLMAAGRAAGAYWGMPTQATANAMYDRQKCAMGKLFADGARPQLALAHGSSRFHDGFQATILRNVALTEDPYGSDPPDESASTACAAFLADDSRTALIADLGAGTIDQAILGVLPARFQAVRLFGLSDKVLVVDEAHAYDAYMGEELRALLQFQAAMGGSSIVLSATLPMSVHEKAGREQLVRAWMEGCGARVRDLRGRVIVKQTSYPLMTVAAGQANLREYPVAAASWSHRSVSVRFVSEDGDIVSALVAAARVGAAVAWVRNTVDDVLAGAQALRRAGVRPIIFHARFAYSDRQRIEAEVMSRFGIGASDESRRGTIVIATQVIEQSLDLDFDYLASDLAPIDLLIQRAGRLRRHRIRDAGRPDVPFELLVRAPIFDGNPQQNWLLDSMPGTSFVYQDPALLWRTMSELKRMGVIETPGGVRSLIESVYGEHAAVPVGLDSKALRAEGIGKALAGRARQVLLRVHDGYRGEQMAWVAEDHLQVSTRLGSAQTTIRLAQIEPSGVLRPWAEADSPRLALWSLSEVKTSVKRAPPDSQPNGAWKAAAVAARAQWGRRERERRDMLILPLERLGDQWRGELVTPAGRAVKFCYATDIGLMSANYRDSNECPTDLVA